MINELRHVWLGDEGDKKGLWRTSYSKYVKQIKESDSSSFHTDLLIMDYFALFLKDWRMIVQMFIQPTLNIPKVRHVQYLGLYSWYHGYFMEALYYIYTHDKVLKLCSTVYYSATDK